MTKEFVIEELQKIINESTSSVYDVAVADNDGTVVITPTPANNCNNAYSVAKTFTVTAIEMLQDKGLLDVHDKIFPILRDSFPEGYDKKWEKVTIEDCMKHKMGIDHGFLDIDCDDIDDYGTDDWLRFALGHDLPLEPGTEDHYSDAAFYILSRIVAKVSGQDLFDFLIKELFTPMKFKEVAWSKCPYGYAMGATGLYTSAADVAKLGLMYLNKGVYKGRRYLSEKAANEVLEKNYELKNYEDHPHIYSKMGMCGQMLLISTDYNICVAWHTFDTDEILGKMYDRCCEILSK